MVVVIGNSIQYEQLLHIVSTITHLMWNLDKIENITIKKEIASLIGRGGLFCVLDDVIMEHDSRFLANEIKHNKRTITTQD